MVWYSGQVRDGAYFGDWTPEKVMGLVTEIWESGGRGSYKSMMNSVSGLLTLRFRSTCVGRERADANWPLMSGIRMQDWASLVMFFIYTVS